jgi:hypothetical protein
VKVKFLVGFILVALPCLALAFPFWLNSPSRSNPNDPENTLHISSNTVSSSKTPGGTPSPSVTPTALVGATLPYIEYEAESATAYTGTLIGPNTKMAINGGTIGGPLPSAALNAEAAAESSGREAVALTAQGQSVQFTTQKQCNSIVVRYIIPDAAGGGGINATLSCYVNGTFNQELAMTSVFDWDYGNSNMSYSYSNGVNQAGYDKTPSAGTAFHLYDETHAMLGEEVPANSTITLQVGPGDTAAYYVIDFIDLEDVVAPLSMPAGFVSIAASPYNAVSSPYGTSTTALGADCSAAIQACVNANTHVWIPAGNFACLSAAIHVRAGVTIAGAGMWYSGLSGYYATLNLTGSNSVFSNFYLDGYTTNRDDGSSDCGFNNGGGTGSSVTDVWVEHEKVGYWMSQGSAVSNGMTITGCRFRDLYADGVNINEGSSNCTVTQCNFRNTGDDSLASWSQSGYAANTNNTFSYNTIQNPWRADGLALYGGSSNIIENNICSDTLDQSGIMIDQGFNSTTFSGDSVISDNEVIRDGGYFDAQYGAIDLWGNQAALAGAFSISNLQIQSPTYMGVEFNGDDTSGGTFNDVSITSSGAYPGIEVESGTSGTTMFSNTVVVPASNALQNNGSMTVNEGSGNSPNPL